MKKQLNSQELKSKKDASSYSEKQPHSRQDKITDYIIYGMIVILVIFGVYAYLGNSSLLNKSMAYKYSNGESTFEVRRISENECQIKVFFSGDPKPYVVTTRYDPARLEDVNISRRGLNAIKDDKHVYFTIDPYANMTGNTVIATMELGKFISNRFFFNIPSSGAVTKPYNNKTVVSCKDANQFMSVIELRLGDKNQIYSEHPGCIIIEGTNENELIRGADRLALYWIGVMK